MKTMPSFEFRRSVKKELCVESESYGSGVNERTPLRRTVERSRWRAPKPREGLFRRFRVLRIVASLVIAAVVASFSYSQWKRKQLGSSPYLNKFKPAAIQVPRNRSGFPSFWDYSTSNGDPIEVSYDKRAVLLNGNRVLFLSGSVHPVRATRSTWELALDDAVRNGLNMITVYLMWNYHQPFQDKPIDWSLPGGDWDLADALRLAANRGLWVHIRPGPYACAEYNYGGIPEWLPLTTPSMRMRRLNRPWLDQMEDYLQKTVDYLSSNSLWAHQGGPIVMAQIENELGGDDDSASANFLVVDDTQGSSEVQETDYLLQVDSHGDIFEAASAETGGALLRNATIQDYADWCGALAQRLVPETLWTMCNGLSANNTVSTFNGVNGVSWLEEHGDTNRIQIDQPAMWIEHEGGFQMWGDSPSHPSDYFWGRTARDMAHNSMQWIARGGTLLNYYMFWGGYNRGRSAAAGVMNGYVTDAILCPSGERRHPKFEHFQALHAAVIGIAPVLLDMDTALPQNRSIEIFENGTWIDGMEQKMYIYHGKSKEVMFVENEATEVKTVRVPVGGSNDTHVFDIKGYSSILLVDGVIAFDSGTVSLHAQSFKRSFEVLPSILHGKTSVPEPVGAPLLNPDTVVDVAPREQTAMHVQTSLSSDYTWYETDIVLTLNLSDVTLLIETQKANSMAVFIDGGFRGESNLHTHAEGPTMLKIEISSIQSGSRRLSILSESLGYNNLIGRWGAPTTGKFKGITGDVILSTDSGNTSLVNGRRAWRSLPGLSLERAGTIGLPTAADSNARRLDVDSTMNGPTWTFVSFATPDFDSSRKRLFLEISEGRGHLFLNQHDLGRYWNITRGQNSSEYSQTYYHLPSDFLLKKGEQNRIALFSLFADFHNHLRLVLSSTHPSANGHTMPDLVGYPEACI